MNVLLDFVITFSCVTSILLFLLISLLYYINITATTNEKNKNDIDDYTDTENIDKVD